MADASSSAPARARKAMPLDRSLSQLQSLPYPDRFFVAARYVGLEISAQDDVQQHTPPGLSDETKLLLYSLYQQATKGPCKDPKPSRWNMVEQAKWTSWERLKDVAPPEAMRLFVRTLEEQDSEWYHKAEPQPAESSQGSADLTRRAAGLDRARQLDEQGFLVADLLSSSSTTEQHQETGSLLEGPAGDTNGGAARTGGQGLDQVDQVDQGFHSESLSLTNGSSAVNGSPRKIRHKHGVGAGIRALAVVNEWISVACSGYRPPGRYQHAAAPVDDKLFVMRRTGCLLVRDIP